MTKLMEWLGALFAFLAVYVYLIAGESNLSDELQLHIKLLPIYLLFLFGVSTFTYRQSFFLLNSIYLKHKYDFLSGILCFSSFQMYAVVTVLYRTFTFNDCPEAAEELQKQIEESKADLSAKGFKL